MAFPEFSVFSENSGKAEESAKFLDLAQGLFPQEKTRTGSKDPADLRPGTQRKVHGMAVGVTLWGRSHAGDIRDTHGKHLHISSSPDGIDVFRVHHFWIVGHSSMVSIQPFNQFQRKSSHDTHTKHHHTR